MSRQRCLPALTLTTAALVALVGCTPGDPAPAGTTAASSTPESSPVSAAPTEEPDGRVTAVECDPASRVREGAATLLAPDVWAIGGWTHDVPGLAQSAEAYDLTPDHHVPSADCGDQKVLGIVLVKKLVDWDQQHVNGIEGPLADTTFGQVQDIVLELRLRQDETILPTDEDLVAAVGDRAPADDVAAIDAQSVDLSLTLYGAPGPEGSRNAGTIVSLDPADLADGWHRVTIPVADLDHWTELDYVRTPVDPAEGAELPVAGLRLNPESTTGTVVRHLLPEGEAPGSIPEVYKEMAIDLALLEVGVRAAS